MSNNLGIMWIAVELTTLASVFLITFHDKDTSLEAGWKFLVLGSLGLVFALLGTVLLFAAGQGRLGEGMAALNWTRFIEAAPYLHPYTLRLGVVFALIGYGTKAGLAPMHTWKPDAYREAPSPAGVLMAGGMLNGALYCLLRVHLISTASLGRDFCGGLLLTLGLLSVLVAATAIFLAALVVLFCGFAYQTGRLVFGVRAVEGVAPYEAEEFDFGQGVTLAAAALAVISTFYLPGPLLGLIRAAAAVVSGGV